VQATRNGNHHVGDTLPSSRRIFHTQQFGPQLARDEQLPRVGIKRDAVQHRVSIQFRRVLISRVDLREIDPVLYKACATAEDLYQRLATAIKQQLNERDT